MRKCRISGQVYFAFFFPQQSSSLNVGLQPPKDACVDASVEVDITMTTSLLEHVLLQRIGSIQFSNSQLWDNCIVEPLVADPLIPIASQVGSGNYLIHPRTRCEITKLTLVEIICAILHFLCLFVA